MHSSCASCRASLCPAPVHSTCVHALLERCIVRASFIRFDPGRGRGAMESQVALRPAAERGREAEANRLLETEGRDAVDLGTRAIEGSRVMEFEWQMCRCCCRCLTLVIAVAYICQVMLFIGVKVLHLPYYTEVDHHTRAYVPATKVYDGEYYNISSGPCAGHEYSHYLFDHFSDFNFGYDEGPTDVKYLYVDPDNCDSDPLLALPLVNAAADSLVVALAVTLMPFLLFSVVWLLWRPVGHNHRYFCSPAVSASRGPRPVWIRHLPLLLFFGGLLMSSHALLLHVILQDHYRSSGVRDEPVTANCTTLTSNVCWLSTAQDYCWDISRIFTNHFTTECSPEYLVESSIACYDVRTPHCDGVRMYTANASLPKDASLPCHAAADCSSADAEDYDGRRGPTIALLSVALCLEAAVVIAVVLDGVARWRRDREDGEGLGDALLDESSIETPASPSSEASVVGLQGSSRRPPTAADVVTWLSLRVRVEGVECTASLREYCARLPASIEARDVLYGAFVCMAENFDVQSMAVLVDVGAPLDSPARNGHTTLCRVIQRCEVARVDDTLLWLLQRGADPAVRCSCEGACSAWGGVALYWCIEAYHAKVADAALSRYLQLGAEGADVDANVLVERAFRAYQREWTVQRLEILRTCLVHGAAGQEGELSAVDAWASGQERLLRSWRGDCGVLGRFEALQEEVAELCATDVLLPVSERVLHAAEAEVVEANTRLRELIDANAASGDVHQEVAALVAQRDRHREWLRCQIPVLLCHARGEGCRRIEAAIALANDHDLAGLPADTAPLPESAEFATSPDPPVDIVVRLKEALDRDLVSWRRRWASSVPRGALPAPAQLKPWLEAEEWEGPDPLARAQRLADLGYALELAAQPVVAASEMTEEARAKWAQVLSRQKKLLDVGGELERRAEQVGRGVRQIRALTSGIRHALTLLDNAREEGDAEEEARQQREVDDKKARRAALREKAGSFFDDCLKDFPELLRSPNLQAEALPCAGLEGVWSFVTSLDDYQLLEGAAGKTLHAQGPEGRVVLKRAGDLREAQIYSKVGQHRYVAAIQKAFKDPDSDAWPYLLVLPWYAHGDLLKYVASPEGRAALTAAWAVRFLHSTAQGLLHLHSHDVLHRDVKPANIFIDGEGQPRIGDFDVSKDVVGALTLTTRRGAIGTAGYIAPEVVEGGAARATFASDVYSLGRVGQWLGERLEKRGGSLPPSVGDLLTRMLQRDPAARPSMDKVLTHACFADLRIQQFLSDDVTPTYWTQASAAAAAFRRVDVTDQQRPGWGGETALDVMNALVEATWDAAAVEAPGRDRLVTGHVGLEVVKVERVENGDLWRRYLARRADLARGGRPPAARRVSAVRTSTPRLDGDLLEDAQECYLFHGTDPAGVDQIVRGGVDSRLCKPGRDMYGVGAYFAEASSKAEEYIPHVDAPVMLVCRVALGVAHIRDTAFSGNRRPPCHEGCAGPCHHPLCDSVVGCGRVREFVVFNEAQSYPEYVLHFRRVPKVAEPSESEAASTPPAAPSDTASGANAGSPVAAGVPDSAAYYDYGDIDFDDYDYDYS
eukprot:TRINITY_DN5584_c0_g2_i1.p1 TRINITY_DN5584_c0_g2~~TRINITY_DN5584_c0_g2_i1.p1  ORF type:complete len:1560 (+),score=207.46 TRINITY_DN5584_c0_g2_i1:1009-5688(+)